MKTVITIETATNGYIIKHGDETIVATTLNDSSWRSSGKSVLELLQDIFEPPRPAEIREAA